MADGYVLSLDIADDRLASAFVSGDLRLAGFLSVPLEEFAAGEEPMEKFLSFVRMRRQTSPGRLDAVALSLSGDVGQDRRTVLGCPCAPWLGGRNVADEIEREMDARFFMDRRPGLLLQHDRVFLGLPPASTAIGFYIGSSYEFAAWDGRGLIRGKHGAAGQLGHIPVPDREDVCWCGKSGCVELYGSGRRLRQLQSLVFPDTPLEKLFTQNRDHSLLMDFVRMLAMPICVGMNIFDPDYVIVGGRVVELPDFPRGEMEAEVRSMVRRPYPGDDCPLLYPSSGGDSAGVMGAACHAFAGLAGSR